MEDQEELKSLENMRINNLKLTKQNLIVRPKMSEAPKEEIKPCPSCGENNTEVYSFGQTGKGSYEETHGVRCLNCTIERASLNEWQNAYCWKELSKVKGELEKLQTENSWLKAWRQVGRKWFKSRPEALEKLKKELKEKDSLLSKQGEEIKELLDFVRSASLGLFTTRHVQKIADQVYSKYQPSTPSPEKEK